MADPTPEPAPPRRADAVANRRRLIEAARAAFAALGTSAEVKDIAERAGVGVGTIYRHFGNKEDLLRAIILEAVADFDRDGAEWDRLDDPLAALEHYLTGLLTLTENYGWLFDAILSGQLPDRVTHGLEGHGPETRLIAILARGIDAGVLDPDLDMQIATNAFLGLAITWKYGKLRQTMTVQEMVSRTLRLFLRGAGRPA